MADQPKQSSPYPLRRAFRAPRLAFETYLRALGRMDQPALGSNETPREAPTQEANRKLQGSLVAAMKVHNSLFGLCVFFLCLIVALQVALIIYGASSGTVPTIALGGGGFLLLPVVGCLRRLWLDSKTLEIAQIILKEGAYKDVADIIEAIYWDAVRGRRKRESSP